jgi:hypothetical protein
LVEVHCVEKVFLNAQFVAPFFEFFRSCARSGRLHSMQRRWTHFHLFRTLSLQRDNEKTSEEK